MIISISSNTCPEPAVPAKLAQSRTLPLTNDQKARTAIDSSNIPKILEIRNFPQHAEATTPPPVLQDIRPAITTPPRPNENSTAPDEANEMAGSDIDSDESLEPPEDINWRPQAGDPKRDIGDTLNITHEDDDAPLNKLVDQHRSSNRLLSPDAVRKRQILAETNPNLLAKADKIEKERDRKEEAERQKRMQEMDAQRMVIKLP